MYTIILYIIYIILYYYIINYCILFLDGTKECCNLHFIADDSYFVYHVGAYFFQFFFFNCSVLNKWDTDWIRWIDFTLRTNNSQK